MRASTAFYTLLFCTPATVYNQQFLFRLRRRNQEYVDLEDEFRMALQIEAKRFHEVCKTLNVVLFVVHVTVCVRVQFYVVIFWCCLYCYSTVVAIMFSI